MKMVIYFVMCLVGNLKRLLVISMNVFHSYKMGLTLMSQKIQFFIHFFVYGVDALNAIHVLPHYLLERRSSSWVFVESETFQLEVEMASNQNHFELYMFWSSFDSQKVRLLFFV